MAFVIGPALLGIWRGAPFLVAASVLAVVTPVFGAVVLRRVRSNGRNGTGGEGGFGGLVGLLRSHASVRWFVVANALWETALSALRAFAVLFVVAGLGKSEAFASGVLAVIVAASVVAARCRGGSPTGWASGASWRCACGSTDSGPSCRSRR